MTKSLKELFTEVNKNLEKNIKLEDLKDLLNNYEGNDWNDYVEFKDNTYSKKIFRSNNLFEIIIISWNNNQNSPIHNHPENGCLMKILKGSLVEERYDNDLKKIETSICNYKDVSYINGSKILHKILNKNQKTVSIHIYSPPNFKIKTYKKFRNYENSKVEDTYKKMLENQTIKYVKKMKKKYLLLPNKRFSIWDLFNDFNKIIDESDPDTNLPQIFHAYQTAEGIKKLYFENNKIKKNIKIKNLFSKEQWNDIPEIFRTIYQKNINEFYRFESFNWLILIGFIHDLGKVLLLDKFGKLPQWSVVGDTFPVGYKLDSNYLYYEKNYHKNNISLNKNTYNKKCGFDKMDFSWGHDEYLSSILEINNINLPKEAIYIIRYHSFYSWHSPQNNKIGYKELASNFDWYMLPLLKIFQKADLYSKSDNKISIDQIKYKYKPIIDKYFKNVTLWM
jgi:inositol oxygenase